jgi:YtkA-like
MLIFFSGSRRFAAAALIRTSLMALLCAVTLAVTACHRAARDTSAGLSIQELLNPEPARVGPATLRIRLLAPSAKPVEGAKITVEADMSHPGMSPMFADAREQTPGDYLATLNFNMGGDWVLISHITLPDGRKAERQMDVRGVRSN